jgi:hypothetical protein
MKTEYYRNVRTDNLFAVKQTANKKGLWGQTVNYRGLFTYGATYTINESQYADAIKRGVVVFVRPFGVYG